MALHQLWLVELESMSAWCGGGFGMFSTTDGWGTRHLHALALSPSFRTRLELPHALAVALAEYAPRDLEAPEAIRVDVFARRHDPGTLAPRGELLRSLELRLEGAPPAP